MKLSATALLFILVFVASCSKPYETEFQVQGWEKQQVRELFGEPDYITFLVQKQFEETLGPKPQFWRSLISGQSVEMWQYKTKEGKVQLYFIDSETVAGITKTKSGVMY